LAAIAKSPTLLESIEGRQFEELISTLMADLGFEDVELTRPTKDGGKDIIAKLRNPKTGWTETYLFECKHWLAGDKVRLKIVTRLQDVVRTDKATGGVIVAWGGYAPEVLQQEASLRKDRLHLRDKNDIERWVSYWERTYASPIIVPLNPFEVFGLEV
jgi:hypothetical protein